jgi:1-piperideine-2-carboxylate/1-pyrroline-2-carboxylate reductase [NAD(P)H]
MSAPLLLSPQATAAALPYPALAREIEALLRDPSVVVPPRLVQPLPGGGSLFVMPAVDAQLAITKLITFVAGNAALGLPTIQGDIVVFDARCGQRLVVLDGPTVTARRTAAVSLLAAQRLAPQALGPLLIVGAGVQGRAHLEAFHEGLGTQEVMVASRTPESAQALVAHARTLGMHAEVVADANAALADCPLVVSCTPAQGVVLSARPRTDVFVAAVGAFTPRMVEWSPQVCQHLQATGQLVVDTRDADHEAGDLLQAGIDVTALPTLADMISRPALSQATGPVFFKSCGWAGWDLAAARLVCAGMRG